MAIGRSEGSPHGEAADRARLVALAALHDLGKINHQGATFVEIGACVGTGANVVSAFAKRHWPRREARPAMSRPRAALMVFGAKAIDLSLHEGQ